MELEIKVNLALPALVPGYGSRTASGYQFGEARLASSSKHLDFTRRAARSFKLSGAVLSRPSPSPDGSPCGAREKEVKIAARVAGLWAGTPSRSIASEQIIRLGNLPNRIDLLTTVSGVEFAACYPARITVDIDGVAVNSIDLENLEKSQQAAGRREDLADLEALG